MTDLNQTNPEENAGQLNVETSEQNEHNVTENFSTEEDVQKDEKELEEMKKKMQEMEEEARKLKEMQEQVEIMTNASISTGESKEEVDARSVFVGNVDFSATAEELQQHFQAAGTINRVTILCDKHTGHPKGYAYIEFVDKQSVANALELNESIFKGRPLKVAPKRTNVPYFVLNPRRRGFRPRWRRHVPGYGYRSRRPHYHPYA